MQVNLARKWRSRTFEDLIGQPLVVRTLKNSLYKEILFPVYLFTGTRGCGKTSAARIFASALNCELYQQFKDNPQKIVVPCLACASCKAMLQLNHPDFIEIDAASHTGVDNIRNIGEAASFVPSMSQKKIYLIDEAHMLSKAAFNAFLKLLEEPPASVCFILATTELNKIPQTVKSRCLQLFFYPVNQDSLVHHLASVCQQEAIPYENEALSAIAAESEGSVRDALNLIERVRLVSAKVTVESTAQTLGIINSKQLMQLIKLLLEQDRHALFSLLDQQLADIHNGPYFWRRLSQLYSFLVSYKQNLPHVTSDELYQYIDDQLANLMARYPLALFADFIDMAIYYEAMMVKSSQWQLVVKASFLKMMQRVERFSGSSVGGSGNASGAVRQAISRAHLKSSASSASPSMDSDQTQLMSEAQPSEDVLAVAPQQVNQKKTTQVKPAAAVQGLDSTFSVFWEQFLQKLEKSNEFLVSSILRQAQHIEQQENELHIMFEKHLTFYQECLDNSKSLWQPMLDAICKMPVKLNYLFTKQSSVKKQEARPSQTTQEAVAVPSEDQKMSAASMKSPPVRAGSRVVKPAQGGTRRSTGKILQIHGQEEQFKKSSLLLKFFPGTIIVT